MLPRAPGQAPIRTCAAETLVQQSNLSAIADAVPGCLRFFRPSYGPTLAALLALLVMFAPGALAGPHEGGTLILHADPGEVYSVGEAYCGVELTACSLAVVQVPADPNTTTVFHALAAFPEAAQVDLRGVQFGISYDAQRLVLVAHGSCADFVIPTPDWPASGGGVGMLWGEAQTDRLVDLYWFAGYAYSSSEPTVFELTPHPVQGGAFADGSMPAVLDTVAAYGALGFGMPGLLACPVVEEGQDSQPYTDPSDGGAFRCGKSLVSGGISVRPSSIVIADGVWSLLVKAKDLDAAERVKLRIGSTDHLPALAVRTTDSTSVLTFRYEASESDTEASVLFPDGELQRLISLDAHGLAPQRYHEDVVSVKTRYGALQYPPGAEERTLDELEGTDEDLLTLMRQTGCRVRRKRYMDTEDPSPDDPIVQALMERGGNLELYASLLRNYTFLFSPDVSERAMSLIFAPHPAVEWASVSAKITQQGAYSPCNPPYYHGQWNCRHWVEFPSSGWYGTGVNWAWTLFTGLGTEIAVIDHPYPQNHPAINWAVGDAAPPPGSTTDHGLECALIAAAKEDCNPSALPVGYAFDAGITPVYIQPPGDLDALASAFLRAMIYRPSVISISVCANAWNQDLLQAITQCYNDNIPIVASAGHRDNTCYPAIWDQRHAGHNLVLSVNASKKNGTAWHNNADIYAPGESLTHPLYPNWLHTVETGSYSVPQVAAAIAISRLYELGPDSAYDHVLESAYRTSAVPILDAARLNGITGIHDITDVEVVGGDHVVWLRWRVTNPDNISHFVVHEGASCWGKFDFLTSFDEGDPFVTPDREYYELPIYAPYDRTYYFKLLACHGGCALYQAEGWPAMAAPVNPEPPPSNVSVSVDGSEAELKWWRGGSSDRTEYWVLRRAGHPIGNGCPEGGEGLEIPWGSFLHGVMADGDFTCSRGKTTAQGGLISARDIPTDVWACWYDNDLYPSGTYYYRVASVRRGYNNRVEWASGLSDEVSGSGWPTSIEDAAERAARLEVSVSPTPVLRGGSATRLQAAGIRGGDGTVSIYDVRGRKLFHQRMGSQLRDGRFTMDLEGKDELGSAGVYFCRVEDDSGQLVERKIVVIR